MAQNRTEKIVQKYALNIKPGQKVHSGDFVTIQPAYVMTHDNTGAVIKKFNTIGVDKFANPRQVVHTLDHNIQDKSEKNIKKYKAIEEFAKKMGNDFYPAGRGIGHQIMIEEGYAFPGTMVVASDSHSNMYGGIGALGTPIVRTDAAAIWASGKTWWQIPPVAKVILNGKLRKGVTGKDVIIALCGIFKNDEVLNHVVEFEGEALHQLTLEQRLTIANMTTEWGALGGLFPIDEITIGWLRQRADKINNRGLAGVPSDADGKGVHPRLNHAKINELEKSMNDLQPDDEAYYAKTLEIDLEVIEPSVSGPNSVKVFHTAKELESKKIKINKAYLVSCVNSRNEDIAQAAKILNGQKIAQDVEFYVAAASNEVQMEAEANGDWQILLDAGATPLPPGCGPCIGLGAGLLEDGEVGISATNRNFKGRMGSKEAEAYLASPEVVAYSAIKGYIASPYEFEPREIIKDIKLSSPAERNIEVNIIDGFPESIKGEVVFCPADNMNTDGIYPGKYTYIDDFSPEDQARVAMENYDPNFQSIAKEGDILIGGFNFGTGSSREQAATALKYRGIKCVIAGSFSATYMRNAINNGYLVIEQPELVNELKSKYGKDKQTIRIDSELKIDFIDSKITFMEKTYPINPIGETAQELIVAGGLENWVKKNLAK